MRKLLPHQELALKYAMENKKIALFLAMRLGKTIITLRWASQPQIKRVLIVAPLPVLPVWVDEILFEEYAEEDVQVIEGNLKQRKQALENKVAKFFLINYEGILSTTCVLKRPFDCIILDESARVKNPKARVTKTIIDGAEDIPYKAILSGLPAPESPLDYFEQFRFLYGRFLRCSNYWSFRRCHFFQVGYTQITPKRTKEAIKKALQEQAFCMTRDQAGIKVTKVYEKRYVELNSKQKRLIKQIEAGFEYKIGKEEQQTKWIPVKFVWMGIIAGGFTPEGLFLSDAKLKEIINLLKGELKGEQIVIWFRYNREIEYVSKKLRKLGFKVGVFTGAQKEDGERFKKKQIQVICAQAQAGKYGLNWSNASTAIYYSNHYSGEIRYQSEDRIVHPKKKEPLLYIDLIAKGSIDTEVVEILRQKKLNTQEFAVELQSRWQKRLHA